ncbi:hypothetical protein [Aporhodopirellula aestuarii]|uniref:hypothetical protein n=1 Tax=Aporhodopirellula aestuarii TaxID=2950107 RepID=UPI0020348F9A|nr:hypothetical protein [Aporhodopirellula aestuarii]
MIVLRWKLPLCAFFAVALAANTLTLVGCGTSSEPTVIERPSELSDYEKKLLAEESQAEEQPSP